MHNYWDTSIYDKFVANNTLYRLPCPELMSKLINIFHPTIHTLFSANPIAEILPRITDNTHYQALNTDIGKINNAIDHVTVM